MKITLSPCAVSSWNFSDHNCFLSVVMSISSASFIPVISYIHFLLGRPRLLLTSSHANNVPFSNPSCRITGLKNHSFLPIAVCCSVSSSIPISKGTLSLVLFSVNDILCSFLHIHISQALILFATSLPMSTCHNHTELSGNLSSLS